MQKEWCGLNIADMIELGYIIMDNLKPMPVTTVTKEEKNNLKNSDKKPEKVLTEIIKSKKDIKSKSLEKKLKSQKKPKGQKPQQKLPIKDEYLQHTDLYKSFFSEYMKTTQQLSNKYEYYTKEDKKENAFSWGDELISYKERKDYVRKIMMNSLLHGAHNPIDPRTKELYEFWKLASKFNEQLSMAMYDKGMGWG